MALGLPVEPDENTTSPGEFIFLKSCNILDFTGILFFTMVKLISNLSNSINQSHPDISSASDRSTTDSLANGIMTLLFIANAKIKQNTSGDNLN